jgi:AhpD family alkylhydroperoxidase
MKIAVLTRELIAVGASVTANCRPCLQYHMAKAREAGADDEELATAIAIAKTVRKGAAAGMDEFAAGLGADPVTAGCGAGQGCGCGA